MLLPNCCADLRGGAAVVMGALSPRTRNAQVEMFQSGEVDYLVATDAIGMGLNLDVHHIAFAGLSKFDGNRTRRLRLPKWRRLRGGQGGINATGPLALWQEKWQRDDARRAARHRRSSICPILTGFIGAKAVRVPTI